MATPTIYKTTSTAPSLDSPKGLAIDTDIERLLICDGDGDQIVRCYIDGIKEVDTTDSYDGNSFDTPTGACYYGGNYYVCDSQNDVMVRFRARDLAYKDLFGTYQTPGSGNSALNTPKDVCTDGEYLYVCDATNNRILKLSLDTMTYDSKSSSINGALSNPSGICIHKDGLKNRLYISDTSNDRIIKCKTDFTYIEENSTNVTSPTHMVVVNDHVHICNGGAGYDDIVVLKSEGLALATSYSDASIQISNPYGIAHWRGAIIISDTGGDRITVWRAYNPRDDFTQTTPAKFGGVFFDNPMMIVDVDTVTVGDTSESGTVNRWKEENKNIYSIGFVEEDSLTSPSWSEES